MVLYLMIETAFAEKFEKTAPFLAFDEIRLGAFAHAVENNKSEDGVDINAEILFGRPTWHHENRWINHFIRPRPHIGGHVNLNGDTNMFYFGVTWDIRLTNRLFFESSFGGAVHDGPLNVNGKSSYGCQLNFRQSASLGLVLSENWRLLATIDHMSNANLCDRNRGLTNIGARLGYRLN